MSCVSILIRRTILTQRHSGEGSDSVVGTGHNLASQGGVGFGGAGALKVTVQDGAPLREEAEQTPWGKSGSEQETRRGRSRPPSARLGGGCLRARVCQEGQARKPAFSGHLLGTRPDARPMTSSPSSTLSSSKECQGTIISKTVDRSPVLGYENNLVGDK